MLQALKYAEGSDDIIEGLAIPFGGPNRGKDFDGEDFGPDTDFALDWFPQGRPLVYHHGNVMAVRRKPQRRHEKGQICKPM